MRSLILAPAALVLMTPAPLRPQAPPPTQGYTTQDVGVDEKLGQTVPLDLILRDEDGKPVRLRDLITKPTILTLNYFRCAGICTPQLIGVQEVANLVKSEPGKDFQILTVSFDPRDTAEVAAQKRVNYLKQVTRPFPPSGWRFLTGEGATTKALADAVGFRFKQEGEDFAHAGVLMILSPEGKVTRYMYGVTYLPADLDLALQEASRGEARPSIVKFLKFCFTTEADGRKSVLSLTKVSAAVMILGAILFGLWLGIRGRRTQGKNTGDHA